MRRIDGQGDLDAGLEALLVADPRLAPVAEKAGPLPLRRRPCGFEGLAAVVTSQQISSSAAASIWARLEAAIQPFTPQRLLAASDETLRTAGLSRAKVRTLAGIAAALRDGFDLAGVEELPPEEARAALIALKGIGPWTADIYLLF